MNHLALVLTALLALLPLAACSAAGSGEPGTVAASRSVTDEALQGTDAAIEVVDVDGASTPLSTKAAPTSSPPVANQQETAAPLLPGSNNEEFVIIFKRSGGFAGLDDFFSIAKDGRVVAADGRTWQADPDEVEILVQDLLSLGFFDLQESYKPADPCCDHIFVELGLDTGERTHTVSAVAGDPGVPDQFTQMLALVQQFVDRLMLS